MADIDISSAKEALFLELRSVLRHLYDPTALRRSVLAQLMEVDPREDPAAALQSTLTDTIQALKPNRDESPRVLAWRIYHVLCQRYVEQFAQRQVASNLGLSPRQLRREEIRAVQALADTLWIRYGLETKTRFLGTAARQTVSKARQGNAGRSARTQELEWLKRGLPGDRGDVGEMLQSVLKTVSPLAEASRVQLQLDVQDNLPPSSGKLTAIKQALVNVATAAINRAPGGQIVVRAEALRLDIRIQILATGRSPSLPIQGRGDDELLKMAEQLVQISGGSLEILSGESEPQVLTAKVTLPAAEQVKVLVVDDNVDALQLMQRYLSSSRYLFVGTRDPEEALLLAEGSTPYIIVLDIMLPGIDGWEILGRLREHPRTRGTPIVVCTVLPQEQLALTLGAADFIRKPVSRTALLEALDRQLAPSSKQS